MLAKVTGKNQLTLPKAVLQQIGEVEYFDINADDGKIVLTPVKLHSTERIRRKLEELGITENDIAEAVSFARQR
jgi:bifunctional DNA-binding transcriptional regulator/antitoxin component of YhaV-PrlF toxin-antitoxin module